MYKKGFAKKRLLHPTPPKKQIAIWVGEGKKKRFMKSENLLDDIHKKVHRFTGT